MSLNVEPGGKPLIARLTNGSAPSFCSAFQSFALMLGMKVFGSNDGTEAIAKMLPLFGSTTTAPARLTARIDRQENVGALLRRIFAQHALDSSLRILAQITHARFSTQIFVHLFFDVRFSFDVLLIKGELPCFLFIDVVRHADITKDMGG